MNQDISATAEPGPGNAARQVTEALNRLRTIFPLEARIAQASVAARACYRAVLQRWAEGATPQINPAQQAEIRELVGLDALVIGPEGIGCYPFSARDTGIRVEFDGRPVSAMCAVDALAMARVLDKTTRITAPCHVCGRTLSCAVEANGGLTHDQTEAMHVAWQSHAGGSSCSSSLCRGIYFLCTTCPAPRDAARFTLPQATAIGNAFFSFQRRLLQAGHPA